MKAVIYVTRLLDEVEVEVEGDGATVERATTADGREIALSADETEQARAALLEAVLFAQSRARDARIATALGK